MWRLPGEAYNKYNIRRRWKGFSEFMFGGRSRTIRRGLAMYRRRRLLKRRERKADLDMRNSLIEKANRQKWEKEQRKWLRDWTKAHGRAPEGVVTYCTRR